jgi:hypothetical protein
VFCSLSVQSIELLDRGFRQFDATPEVVSVKDLLHRFSRRHSASRPWRLASPAAASLTKKMGGL